MKKSIISMMLVGEPSANIIMIITALAEPSAKIIMIITALAVMLGTVNSYGSTSTKKSHFQTTKTEKVVNNDKKQDKNCDCKNCRELDKKQNYNKKVVGGYSQQRNLTKQDKQLFKNTYHGKDKLTPVSVSTQVVNGTNYKYICKDKHGRKVTVTIYQSLSCYGSKSKVVSIN